MLRLIIKNNIVLVLVVLLAFCLRFYKVTQIPPSLNWDEASIGYNAYSLLKTGRDEWGVKFPLHFQSYGEYKLPAQIYASIPAIAVFGLNPFGVRITPVIYGTLTVLVLYLLVREVFRKRKISLLAAFLLAVSPWHIQLTRASFESSFSVFWIIIGIWLLIKGFNGKKFWWMVSIIPFVISVYTYNSARIFTPLFLLIVLVIYRKEILKHTKELVLAVVLFIIFLLPLVPFILSGEASARYKLVSITDEEGLIPRINERRGLSTLPKPLPRLIHNKVTYISYYFAKNYLAHFTPDFLFISGVSHRQHHVQGMGELYKIQAPFLLVGLYFLFKRKEKYRWFLIIWLLLAFVPVATTRDSIPNALRTLIAAPFYQVVTAYGFWQVLEKIKNRKGKQFLLVFSALVLVFELSMYLKSYYYSYAKNYSRDWQYGYQQAVKYISEHYGQYDQIVFSRYYGEPHMFTLFYLNYPPEKYQNNENLVRYKAYDWVWVTRFDKFYFPNLSDEGTGYKDVIMENLGKKILFVGRKEDFPDDAVRLKTIDFLDGKRAFDIVESK